jgi:hypothetical protein
MDLTAHALTKQQQRVLHSLTSAAVDLARRPDMARCVDRVAASYCLRLARWIAQNPGTEHQWRVMVAFHTNAVKRMEAAVTPDNSQNMAEALAQMRYSSTILGPKQ